MDVASPSDIHGGDLPVGPGGFSPALRTSMVTAMNVANNVTSMTVTTLEATAFASMDVVSPLTSIGVTTQRAFASMDVR